jgi:pimeloyl-ACP methyl ester carboxylesterase
VLYDGEGKQKMSIYLLGGIGMDKRTFDFVDLSGYDVHFITWIPFLHKETIENYSRRLLDQIVDENPILIGVSFGGVVAIEIGKHIRTEKIILISSVQTKFDVPLFYRVMGKLRLHEGVPTMCFRYLKSVVHWFFGVEDQFQKKLLSNVIMETDTKFLEWAVDQITRWKNCTPLKDIIHIHGTNDRIFPRIKSSHVKIPQGSHFMIISKAQEINRIIRSSLKHEKALVTVKT